MFIYNTKFLGAVMEGTVPGDIVKGVIGGNGLFALNENDVLLLDFCTRYRLANQTICFSVRLIVSVLCARAKGQWLVLFLYLIRGSMSCTLWWRAMLSTDCLMVSRTRWQGGLLDRPRKPKWVKREVLDLPRDARVMREAVKVKE